MKKIITLFLLVCVVKFSYAQPPAGLANAGDTYGEKVDAKGAITTAELVTKMNKTTDTLQTKVTGKVLAVCPKKGCWWSIEMPDKSTMFVKSLKYNVFVPTDLVGKTVVLDGQAFNRTVSVAELQHYAKDAKKTQAEIDAITKPAKEIRFDPRGVLVVK